MENGFSRWVVFLCMAGLGGLVQTSDALAHAPSALTTSAVRSDKDGKLPEHVPGEVIVKMKSALRAGDAHSEIRSVLSSAFGREAVRGLRAFDTDQRLHKVQLGSAESLGRAIEVLEEHPSIEFAEPNFVYRISVQDDDGNAVTPNDPDFGKLWGLKNTGQTDKDGSVGVVNADVNVEPLWRMGLTGSRKVVVAVIDTGIDVTHPDLVDNLWKNPAEIAGNGIDDDGNGFVDDVYGWNFSENTNDPNDDHNHGTHCAGTIGATGNNGTGVVGVNWKVSMMAVKFLSAQGGGTTEGAIESVNYARKMGAHIISASWGGGGFSQALFDAIQATSDAGMLFVAAAGNDSKNNDSGPSYPATYDVANIVSVAATTNQDTLASFSNYGKTKVHVAAPGKNVLSCFKQGGYGTYSGTSMATPHVSGVAALLMSYGMRERDVSFDSMGIKQRLIQTSDPVPALKRKVVAKGRVDAENALLNVIPPSDDPAEELWQDVEYALESEHPYQDSANEEWVIHQPGAQYIRVVIERFDLENTYDNLFVTDDAGVRVDEVSGAGTNYVTEYVKADTLKLKFVTDGSVNKWGFKISKIQVIR